MGCPLTREHKQKKNPMFIFRSVCVHLRESVRLSECVNTEFDWEIKRGFDKASVSKSCPLTRVSVSGELTVSKLEHTLKSLCP